MFTRIDDNAMWMTNHACAQLFVMYGGLVRDTPEAAMAMLRKVGLDDRNVLWLNDPHACSFRKGIGLGAGSLTDLAPWVRSRVADVPHARAIYHVGFSAGGLAALVTACRLGAERAWAFGARGAHVTHNPLHDWLAQRGWSNRLENVPRFFDEHTAEEEFHWLEDRDFIAECATVIDRCRPTSTRLDYYYCTANGSDAKVAETLKGCRGIAFHPIEVSEAQLDALVQHRLVRRARPRDLSTAVRFATHLTLWVMAETGQDAGVFPPFQAPP